MVVSFVIPFSSMSMRPTLVLGWLLFMAARHSGPVYTTMPGQFQFMALLKFSRISILFFCFQMLEHLFLLINSLAYYLQSSYSTLCCTSIISQEFIPCALMSQLKIIRFVCVPVAVPPATTLPAQIVFSMAKLSSPYVSKNIIWINLYRVENI